MAQSNKISFTITDAEKAKYIQAIEALNELKDKLLEIDTEEIKDLPKMGDKTTSFVTKSLSYCSQNPEYVPGYLDVDEFKIDVDAVLQLREFEKPLLQILTRITNNKILAGSEAYIAALIYYGQVRGAMKAKQPDAETIYNDLSTRFSGRGKGKK